MVCQGCLEITTKLYKYRIYAVANDKHLQIQSGQPYNPPVVNQLEVVLRAAKMATEQIVACVQNGNRHSATNSSFSNHESESAPEVIHYHPSVRELCQQYKKIIFPEEVCRSDLAPVVSLDSEEVSRWYNKRGNCVQINIPGLIIKEISNSTAPYSKSNASLPMEVNTTNSDDDNLIDNADKEVSVLNHHINKSDRSTGNRTFNVLSNNLNKKTILHSTSQVNRKVKKKAGGKSLSNRKRSAKFEEDKEVIPEKKVRAFSDKISKKVTKADLPKQLPNDKTQQKGIGTSSLESSPLSSSTVSVAPPINSESNTAISVLTLPSLVANTNLSMPVSESTPLLEHADCQNIMDAERLLTVFTCTFCNKVFDSRKELIVHERIHLKCRFCKTTLKSIEYLQKHLRESCFINIVKNQPNIKLTKVESIETLVRKYPKTFEEVFEQNPVEVEEYPSSDNNQFRVDTENSNGTVNSSNINNLSLQDSNDETGCIEAPKQIIQITDNLINTSSPTNIANRTPSLFTSTQPGTLNSSLIDPPKPLNQLNDKEMINCWWKKHELLSSKCSQESQTIKVPKNRIKRTGTHTAIIDNLLTELVKHKIPVQFKCHSQLLLGFQEQSFQVQQAPLENFLNWADTQTKDVEYFAYFRIPGNSDSNKDVVDIDTQTSLKTNAEILASSTKQPVSNPMLKMASVTTDSINSAKIANSRSSSTVTVESSSSLNQVNLQASNITKTTADNAQKIVSKDLLMTSEVKSNIIQAPVYCSFMQTDSNVNKSLQAVIVPQNNIVGVLSNKQQNQQVVHVNSNNMPTQYLVVSSSVVSQLPECFNQPLQIKNTSQYPTMVSQTTNSSNASVSAAENQNGALRVKNLKELMH